MAEALRYHVSGITATQARSTNNPLRNYRPAFESIMLTPSGMDKSFLPAKLVNALEELLLSAQSKGVEKEVQNILKIYASEIKNDIILLTINRLSDLVDSSPVSTIAERLEKSSILMCSFQNAADTIPALISNMAQAMGKDFDKLSTSQLHEIISRSIKESNELCPKKVLRTMGSKIRRGDFDNIQVIRDTRDSMRDFPIIAGDNTVKNDVFSSDNLAANIVYGTTPNEIFISNLVSNAQNTDHLGKPEPCGALVYSSPEFVWVDEIKIKKKTEDEPRSLPDIIATVLKKKPSEKKHEKKIDNTPDRTQPKCEVIPISRDRKLPKNTTSVNIDMAPASRKNDIYSEAKVTEIRQNGPKIASEKTKSNNTDFLVQVGGERKNPKIILPQVAEKVSVAKTKKIAKVDTPTSREKTILKLLPTTKRVKIPKEKKKELVTGTKARRQKMAHNKIMGRNLKSNQIRNEKDKRSTRMTPALVRNKEDKRKEKVKIKESKNKTEPRGKKIAPFAQKITMIAKKATKNISLKLENLPKRDDRKKGQKKGSNLRSRKRATARVVLFKLGIQSLPYV